MDLNAPLGKTPPPRRGDPSADHAAGTASSSRIARTILLATGALVAVGALGVLGVTLWRADPHGGEPYAVAAIPPQAAKPVPLAPTAKPALSLDPAATGSLAPNVTNGPQMFNAPPAAAAPPSPGQPLIIDVAKVLADREHGTAGAPSAGEPAPVTPPVALPTSAARVAIFVSGMGLSATATRAATELMPSAVSLAFVPYGDTIGAAVAAAKARGHEILLQVPMQNAAGVPAPGPHALQPGESSPQVGEDVAWLMGRLDGYDGVANLLGAPVTSDRNVMDALMKAVAAHGLFYVDDGTSRRSLGQAVALAQGLPALRADVVLDATADPAVVHANLEALAALAKRNGSAIGMASGLPDHLAAIAAFAAGLSTRGIELVPVSVLAGRGTTRTVAK